MADVKGGMKRIFLGGGKGKLPFQNEREGICIEELRELKSLF